MANGIVTFDCCSLLLPRECDSKCKAKTVEASGSKNRGSLFYRKLDHTQQTKLCTHNNFLNGKALIFIYRNRIVKHLCMGFLQVNDGRSESIIFVSPRYRFFLKLCHVCRCVCVCFAEDMFRIACGSFGIWCVSVCQRDRHRERERKMRHISDGVSE